MAPKRSYTAAFKEDEFIRLKLADEADVLMADSMVILPLSQCARALPSKHEWDLSNILIDGKPVTRKIVVTWLNLAYQYIHSCEVRGPR